MQTAPAKLYKTSRLDTPFVVVFRDPTKQVKTKSGWRARRITKWFAVEADATAHHAALNETLLTEGAAGVNFDAVLRADAIGARRELDRAGHVAMSLLQLALRFKSVAASSTTAMLPIAPEVKAFLEEKEFTDGSSIETIKNLKVRLWMWIDLAQITTVGDITRESVECLRKRGVGKQTRRNDLNAASNFCTWLVSQSPPKLDHHPLKGVRRPRVEHGSKPTFTVEECAAVMGAAGGSKATLAVMIFAGARPSELIETRMIYGRHPMVRIEGGKMKGRANRMVPMSTTLRAWLRAVGDPVQVSALSRVQRETLGTAAGITWKPDICRHTYISNRLQLAQNDALVAREAGTSEAIIFRHYHGLKTPAEARRWAAIRPESPPH